MPTSLPTRKRIRPPIDERALTLLYFLIVIVLLSTMIKNPTFAGLVSNGLQAEFEVSNPLGDDQAMVLASSPSIDRCYCD
jgi:hypothetical protein